MIVRGTARAGAVLFLAGAVITGMADGGYLKGRDDGLGRLAGQLAGLIGYAAKDIRITGLVRQDPESVLTTIGVRPGGSLMGFDASLARRLLENVDWVESASVMRMFPNQLDIEVRERVPFAIWQRDGKYYVIDRSGAAISSLPPGQFSDLILVTGEGAQRDAADLVQLLSGHAELKPHVRAAARAGERRWNLVLDSGIVIELPEDKPDAALSEIEKLDRDHALLSKGITRIDLRVPGKMAVTVAEASGDDGKPSKKIKISRNQ
jgi:cell division protein FtsQ